MPNIKMRIAIIIFILLGIVKGVFSQNVNRWYVEKANGQTGFIDSTGKEIFVDNFENLNMEFQSGLVLFQKDKRKGFLNLNGEIAFTSDKVWGRFSEGLLAFKDESGFYYLNTKGEKAIDLQKLIMPFRKEVSKIFDFKNGLAMVRIKDAGFDDNRNKTYCVTYHESINLYPGNWYYGFIDTSGNWSIKPELESATTFNDSISIVRKNKKNYFLTSKGDLINIKIKNVGEYSEGFAFEYSDNGYYFVNKRGKRINNYCFKRANSFSDGMAAVEINDKCGFIDTSGNIVIEPTYYIRSNFSEGFAAVSLKSDTTINGGSFIEAFIDKNGKEVIPYKRDVEYGEFHNGIAKGRRFIHEDKRYTGYYELFYINKKGEKIWTEILKQ
jgi:hypothetical protein